MANRVDIQVHDASAPEGILVVRFLAKGDPLPEGLTEQEFNGGPKAVIVWREQEKRQILAGIGSRTTVDFNIFRTVAGAALRKIRGLGLNEATFDLTDWNNYVECAVEGAILADYKFEDYLPADKRRAGSLTRLQILAKPHDAHAARHAALRAEIIASITNTIRGLGNLPGNAFNPHLLAEKARELVDQRDNLKLTVLEERQLRAQKFGGILTVGQGSDNPPCLLKLEYVGPGVKKGNPIALVGKAITFDSGGISLKQAASMDEMKWDKMGGLAVLGVMLAIAELKLPLHVVGLVPSAENMPSSKSYRPGDIITTLDGKTIEVGNTDAEGRIILADAIAHVRTTYSPRAIFELSTLTGAIVVALGTKRAGLFTSDPVWQAHFEKASKNTGEMVWHMPWDDEYLEGVQSDIAFAKNTGGREGGACKAASFLKMWAEATPFVHVDIAGTAWITKEAPHMEAGATGFGLRLVLDVLQQLVNGPDGLNSPQ